MISDYNLGHLMARSTGPSCICSSSCTWDPTFGLFRSLTSPFRDTRRSKIGNVPSDLRLILQLKVTRTLYILSTCPKAAMLVRFTLRPGIFEIHGCQKSEKLECTEWPQNKLEHRPIKSALYTISTYSKVPKFGLFWSVNSRIRDTRLWKNGNVTNDLRHLLSPYTVY